MTDRLGIYMQVYNLSVDDKTKKPSVDVRYRIEKDGKLLMNQPEDPANLKKASQQFTIVKSMGLKALCLRASTRFTSTVADSIKKQSINPSATFELR